MAATAAQYEACSLGSQWSDAMKSWLVGSESEMTSANRIRHESFYHYYAKASQTAETFQRFRSIRDCVLRVLERNGGTRHALDVADVGCGAGTQCLVWAELGHRVHGVDVNEQLLELARRRTAGADYVVELQVGSAVKLPWPDESMDVCLVIELLEHVADWEACLSECQRVLKSGGVLFLTTTNKLCPIQQEFALPMYSWYPTRLKRRFERLSITTRPELVNSAEFPAVNWFSFYSLRAALTARGFWCLDRFDVMDLSRKRPWEKLIVAFIRSMRVPRWCAQLATPGTMVAAVKGADLRR
jgi:ubiquinone/menaquinone biosynthesis C-methylase UbiE